MPADTKLINILETKVIENQLNKFYSPAVVLAPWPRVSSTETCTFCTP